MVLDTLLTIALNKEDGGVTVKCNIATLSHGFVVGALSPAEHFSLQLRHFGQFLSVLKQKKEAMRQLNSSDWWCLFLICSTIPIVAQSTLYSNEIHEIVFTPDGATTIDQCPNGKRLMADLSLRKFPPTDDWDVELPNINLGPMLPNATGLPIVVTPAPAFPNSLRLVDGETENKIGRIWAKKPFNLADFYIEVTVLLGNSSSSSGDPRGVAFLFANNGSIIRPNPEKVDPRNNFGIKWENFAGLAFFSQQKTQTVGSHGTYASFVSPGTQRGTPICDDNFKTSCCNVHLPKLENKMATYKIRVTSDDQGRQNLTVLSCVSNTLTAPGVHSEACNGNSNPLQFSTPLWNVSTEDLFFGIAAMNEGYTASVDVFNVSVYNCSIVTTTTTTSTSTSSTTTFKLFNTRPTTTSTISKSAATSSFTANTNREQMSTTIGTTTEPTSTSKASTLPTSAQFMTSPTDRPVASMATPRPVSTSGQTDSTASWEQIILIVNSASQQEQLLLAQQMGHLEDVSTKTVADLLRNCDSLAAKQPAPPPPPNGGATKITPHFSVDRLVEINTVDESITVAGSVLLTWNVTTCLPNDNNVDLSKIYLATTNDVWTPPYRLANSASANTYLQFNENFGEDLIAALGPPQAGSQNIVMSFYWLKEGKFTSSCNLDLVKFPFDTQTCVFTFDLIRPMSSVSFADPKFNWQPSPDSLADTREWAYQGQSTFTTSMYYNAIPTSAIHFSVTVKRNPGFYVINLIIPNAVLMLVELATFIMAPHASDRASLSVTLLLALTVAQSIIMGYIPRTSQPVLLIYYTTALAWLCAACAIYQVIICPYAMKLEDGDEEHHKTHRSCLGKCSTARALDLVASIVATGAFVGIHIYFLSLRRN